MVGHKLGCSVYAKVEHRFYRSAVLSPSINVTSWNRDLNRIADEHWYGDSRFHNIYVICLNKIALLHYINRSRRLHHKFVLINGAVLHVTCTIEDEELGTATFRTFLTGTADPVYSNQHMRLCLSLPETQALVTTFSTKEGHTCSNCNDPATEIPTFKHLTNVEGGNDAETVYMLKEVMMGFSRRLLGLGCTLHPKTLRIQSLIEESNIFAGPPCLARPKGQGSEKGPKPSTQLGPANLYKRDRVVGSYGSITGNEMREAARASLARSHDMRRSSSLPPPPRSLLDNIIGPKRPALNVIKEPVGGLSDFDKHCLTVHDQKYPSCRSFDPEKVQPKSTSGVDIGLPVSNFWRRARIPEKVCAVSSLPRDDFSAEKVPISDVDERNATMVTVSPRSEPADHTNSKEDTPNESGPTRVHDTPPDPGAFEQNAQHMLLTQDLWLSDNESDDQPPMVVGSLDDTGSFEPLGSENDMGVLSSDKLQPNLDHVTPSSIPSPSLLSELTGDLGSPGKSKKYEKRSISDLEGSGIPEKVSKTRRKLNYYPDPRLLETGPN